MKHQNQPTPSPSITRRQALRRLAGAVVSAYVVPEIVFLSAAQAGQDNLSPPTGATSPSSPVPTTSDTGGDPSSEQSPGESCNLSRPSGGNSISISSSDLSRSQEAIQAGYARPLDQIWREFTRQYDGKIIGVEFTGRRRNPRYRFRAISSTGRLETVTISAQTGQILRIVGC